MISRNFIACTKDRPDARTHNERALQFFNASRSTKVESFPCQVPSGMTKEVHSSISNFSHVDSTFGRVSITKSNIIFSPHNPLKGKCTLMDFRPSKAKSDSFRTSY